MSSTTATNLLKADFSKLKHNQQSGANQYGVNYFLEYDGKAPIFAVTNGTVLQAPTLQIGEQKIAPRLKVTFDEATMAKFDSLYQRTLEIIKENKWFPDNLSIDDLKNYFKNPYEGESYTFTDNETKKEIPVDLPAHVRFEFQLEDKVIGDKLKEYDGQLLEDEKKNKIILSSLQDLRKFLPTKSTCRLIFRINRVYIAKPKKKEPKYFGNYNHVPHLCRRTSSAPGNAVGPVAFSDDENDAADENDVDIDMKKVHWDDVGVDMDKDPEDDF